MEVTRRPKIAAQHKDQEKCPKMKWVLGKEHRKRYSEFPITSSIQAEAGQQATLKNHLKHWMEKLY